MIPRFKADFGWAELSAALTPSGPAHEALNAFERRFAALFDQKHAIATPYGRTGLIFVLNAMGLQDDEVLCPAYTCLVVPEAIEKSGNHTVFVDCVAQDYNVDFDLLEQAVSPKTKAFIATSIFGHPLNLDKLAQFRACHPQIKIIQDCAHSFAAEWNGQSVVPVGDAALFGLNISKTISSVFGGMVTTDDTALATRLREINAARLTQPGWLKPVKRRLYLIASMLAFVRPAYKIVNMLERAHFLDRFTVYHNDSSVFMPADYLEALGAFEARIGLIQTRKYAQIIAHRRQIAALYFKHLAALDGPDFKLPVNDLGATYSHFAIRTPHATKLIKTCHQRGIQLGSLIDYHCPDNGAFQNARYVGNKEA
ncbi:MAG: DegT/DnrJ/EryC1/StrS family aminotransferase, partial [Planktotalea sp.]|uniref:DegT/DnrJ/EryC1/StrS family aminotransferase n=1 Tax=Planktotalea sp. TaxID=2029877 RepID=UPI003C763DF3